MRFLNGLKIYEPAFYNDSSANTRLVHRWSCAPAGLGCVRWGAFSCALIYANVVCDTSTALLKFTALFAQYNGSYHYGITKFSLKKKNF